MLILAVCTNVQAFVCVKTLSYMLKCFSILISGNESDIYDYYETNSFGSFQRKGDDDDDDDDDGAEDYEPLDDPQEPQDEPPTRLPPDPTSPSRDHGQVVGNVRITSMAELDRTPRSNPGGKIIIVLMCFRLNWTEKLENGMSSYW